LALELANAADALTTSRFQATDLQIRRKPDRTPVTDADTAVEDAIRAILGEKRPQDTILGEERGSTPAVNNNSSAPSRHWVIDPIDGTKNFLRGVPVWATLLALVIDGNPTVGVISAPLLNRRWWASAGAGAWVQDTSPTPQPNNPRHMQVSQITELADSYLSTTHLGSWTEHHSREAYLALVDACWENRAYGDFWQHCLVAEGVIDIAAEPIVNPWDVAAVQIIVTEAGGKFSDLQGQARFDGGSALSSNGILHEAALTLLQR
jgi:histidinol-phosphatase